jgi:glycosyltransferase involved in cell wall biosynthesis
MKLIVLQPYINLRGGVDRVLLKIAEHYKAPIYTLEYDKSSSFEDFGKLDIRMIGKDVPFQSRLPYRASQGLKYGYNFYNIKIEEDYDVLNPHISPSEWIRHKNERVLWYCHTPPREVYDLYSTRMKGRGYGDKIIYATFARAYKLIANKVVKDLEGIATNSETTRSRIRKYYGRDARVINPGVDVKKYKNVSYEDYFFYPSRILVNKRQDYVIDAFKRFEKKDGRGKFRLVIAGTLSKDPEHQAYMNRIKKMAEGYKIQIITNIDEGRLIKLYSGAMAVLFSAINEDFGFIPLEAMASSKPIISVNEGGPRETVKDGKTGFLVGSPQEMAEKMLLLARDTKAAEHMGKEGRKEVERNYTWERFFSLFDGELERIKKGKKEDNANPRK